MQPTTKNLVNAWISIDDEPFNTKYDEPTGCYQTLIKYDIYQSIDILYICFVKIVPTGIDTIPYGDGSSYTLQMDNIAYMKQILRDARKNNSDIKLGVTLDYKDKDMINRIFSSGNPTQDANRFATNLFEYMFHYGLNALDVFWDGPLSNNTTVNNFKYFFSTIGKSFRDWNNTYYLSISPANNHNTDTDTINDYINIVNLQLYKNTRLQDQFNGVSKNLFAYGAKFESTYPTELYFTKGYQTALSAYMLNTSDYHFNGYINWRLNSENFLFEQTQQQVLYALIHNNYKAENDWGSSMRNPAGTWTFGCRYQHVIMLNVYSNDGGKTLKGSLQYDGLPEMEVIATLIDKYTYMVQESYRPVTLWKPGGTWLMGRNPNKNLVAVNISSFNNGLELRGTITYSEEAAMKFYAELQRMGG